MGGGTRRRALVVAVTVFVVLAGCSGDDGPSDDAEAIAAGNVALCQDGSYSDNTSFDDTCSSHDEVKRWLAEYGRCADGRIIRINTHAGCNGEGFDQLMEAGYEPEASAADVARCEDETFSDNTSFHATCSTHGGVAEWLADWGECGDGSLVRIGPDTSCSGHDGFAELKEAGFTPEPGGGDIALCGD